MTLNFKDCTLAQLDKLFGLDQIEDSSDIQSWLEGKAEITEIESQILTLHRQTLKSQGHDWNETELQQQFIGPVFALANFATKKFSLFAERAFSGTIDGIEMTGRPDGMIARGFREPEKPFFCLQEYKREIDPYGDPAGQVLAAMLVAQEINDHKHPIYGCYIHGPHWYFLTLNDKNYCISSSYNASRPDIFDIFRILKVLKQIIMNLIASV